MSIVTAVIKDIWLHQILPCFSWRVLLLTESISLFSHKLLQTNQVWRHVVIDLAQVQKTFEDSAWRLGGFENSSSLKCRFGKPPLNRICVPFEKVLNGSLP